MRTRKSGKFQSGVVDFQLAPNASYCWILVGWQGHWLYYSTVGSSCGTNMTLLTVFCGTVVILLTLGVAQLWLCWQLLWHNNICCDSVENCCDIVGSSWGTVRNCFDKVDSCCGKVDSCCDTIGSSCGTVYGWCGTVDCDFTQLAEQSLLTPKFLDSYYIIVNYLPTLNVRCVEKI